MYNPSVYVKFNVVTTSYDSYSSGADNGVTEEVDVFVKFYSDAACTIPVNLSKKMVISYLDGTETYYSNNTSSYSDIHTYVRLEPGSSSYLLEHMRSQDINQSNGTYRDGSFYRTLYLENGVGYIAKP